MVANIRQLRRLYEAAQRDRQPGKFFEDLREGLESKALRPSDFSIRQLFENFVEDGRELVDSWNPRQGGGVSMLEASNMVDTSAFSNITGQIVYSAIMEKYMAEEFVFTKLFPTQPTQFNGEKIAGIGQLGDQAEAIAEGRPYPTAGVNEDWIETPATTKRGLIVPVTKEAVFFDRTGVILERCGDVGNWLGVNKEKRAIDCAVDENVTTHRYKWRGTVYASYQTTSPWDNTTASNAMVDWTDIDAAEQTLAAITDPNTGEPILLTAKHITVNRELLNTARRIVNATELRTAPAGYPTNAIINETTWPNPVVGYSIVSSLLLASRMATDTTWFLGDWTKYAKYMENWPITVVQAPNNSEAEFTQDIVFRYKASERGQFAVVEPRAVTKCTVA